ncbi:MAG: anthranilate phosphoribosyltransferase [Bacillota bacterium]
MIVQAIGELVQGRSLLAEDMAACMREIMNGEATEAQMSAFLVALRMKGETVEEIAAAAGVMLEKAEKIESGGVEVLDVVGTGGDCANTFNVSTIVAIVVAAAGYPVAKHGNRSVSSKCGSADLLEALGVKIDMPVAQNQKIFDELGICFMFAPLYHTSMRHVAGVRKALALRTIFNILGPLSNPARAQHQLLGVYDEKLIEPMAQVLLKLGVKRGLVVCGRDGLDEVSLCVTTEVCEIDATAAEPLIFYNIHPSDFGLEVCSPADLVGGDPARNAEIALEIFGGAHGPKRDMVLLNAALALHIAAPGLSVQEAFALARETIDSGKARRLLESWRGI